MHAQVPVYMCKKIQVRATEQYYTDMAVHQFNDSRRPRLQPFHRDQIMPQFMKYDIKFHETCSDQCVNQCAELYSLVLLSTTMPGYTTIQGPTGIV